MGVIWLIGLVACAHAAAEPVLEGRVLRPSGAPVAGAQVLLFDLADLGAASLEATADESGAFTLPLGALGLALPERFELGANYPNPFNPSTLIPYQLPVPMRVRLEVFNLLGQRIATLVDGQQPAGFHTAAWDATDAAGRAVGAGVYLYRLSGGGTKLTRRMLLLDGQAGISSATPGGPATARGESMEAAPGYGLAVSGPGLIPYVAPAFPVTAGMAPVEVVLEAPAAMPRAKVASSGGILGDVDNSGRVSLTDLLLVALYSQDASIVMPNSGDIWLGDVDADGQVGLSDIRLLYAWLLDPADPSLPAGIGEAAGPAAALSPDPSTVSFADDEAWHRFTVQARAPVSVVANPGAGTPRLQITPLGGRSNDCPAEADKSVGRRDGEAVYLSGCAAGEATVELRRESDGTVLRTYTFEVTGRPDLVVESVSANSSLTKGQFFILRATVRNQGTAAAAATTLRWYRSPDATVTTRDSLVGTDAVSLLAPSGTSAESVHQTAPSSEGTYYYGACVVAVAGEADTRNNCSGAVTLKVVRTFDVASDREALVALYHATDGPNWHLSTNWLSDKPLDEWYGVSTDHTGRVGDLNLYAIEREDGTIGPWEEAGYVIGNGLTGRIPVELGNLTHLRSLDLGWNQLTGPIPSELGNLANLESLDLASNQLTGSIPVELGNLTNLRWLSLWESQLTGPIPSELGNLANLESLDLALNQLTGPIPTELGNLANLRWLGLGSNQLTGSIPVELGNLASLESLSLGGNQLNGEIPVELGNLTNLTRLVLRKNQLSGSIPPWLGNLTNLTELVLGSRGEKGRLTGPIPPELGNLANLESLSLGGNQLTGPIPPELGQLTKLEQLWSGHNLLTGPIPPELGNLANLFRLELHSNPLTGEIPPELGQLTNLVYLILNDTNLSGPLPRELIGLPLEALVLCVTDVCVPRAIDFLEWLDVDGIDAGCPYTHCRDPEWDALSALYHGTDGPNWTNRTHWLSGEPLGEWYGVTTDAGGRVTELNLEDNNLRGILFPALGDLANLKRLNLASNPSLSGPLPQTITGLALDGLRLEGTEVCGPPQAEFQAWLNGISARTGVAACTDMRVDYYVLVELFTGTDGPNWTDATNWGSAAPLNEWHGVSTDSGGRVTELSLTGNNLRGPLPMGLEQLTNLSGLKLSGNQLTGEIPAELGQLNNLSELDLSGNQLTGEIPPELGQMTSLSDLVLSGNQLSGEIPPELGQLTNLLLANLTASQLSGEIPPELGQLANLRFLYLGGNRLSGEIPPELGQMTSLSDLVLSGNQLTGSIPPELGRLTNLRELNLSSNQLTGNIPPELGDLVNLESLNLAYNGALSGALPEALTRLGLADLLLRGTFLCPPQDADFQAWLQGIPNSAVANCARLDASTAYLTQAAQSLEYPVPLVAGEAALLRVFVTAAREVDATLPPVRATFYRDGTEVHTAEIDGQAASIPWQVNEGDLSASANALVPRSVVRPGTEMVVEIDPDRSLDPDLGVAVRLPETGRTLLNVRSVPPFDLTLIPFLWTEDPDSTVLAVTDGLSPESDLFRLTRDLLPVRDFRLTVHEPVWTSVDPTSDAAAELLPETDLIYAMEGASGYYMGIFRSAGRGGPLGIAQTPGYTSLSILDGNTIAHELGHNLSLLHSPGCDAGGPDPDYPYEDGSIGVWGYDFLNERLVSAGTSDLMTYCEPQWISDYSFAKALGYRSVAETPPRAAAKSSSPPRGLLLWGGLSEDGELFLEPAFVVRAASFPPRMDGPYRLTGEDEDGDAVFTRSFGMAEISCGRRGGTFAFILPVGADWSDRLVRIVLSGPEGVSILDGEEDPAATLLLDRTTGRVRGLLRDWAEPAGPRPAGKPLAPPALLPEPGLEVLTSPGLPDPASWTR